MIGDTVTFNVGGNFFTTSRDTVLKEPSSKLALIVRGVLSCTQDSQSVFFLDRWVYGMFSWLWHAFTY